MADFTKFFWDKFPSYFHRNDPYMNGSDEGTLERFLSTLEDEVENEVRPAIDNLLDIRDSITTPATLISLLHGDVGSIPLFDDDTIDRNLVLWATSIYKLKGTEAGYVLFFLILGYTATISFPTPEEFTWDSGHNRDGSHHRDTGNGTCTLCLLYDLELDLNGDTAFNDDDYENLYKILDFLTPIHTTLGDLSIIGVSMEVGGDDDDLDGVTTMKTGATDDDLDEEDTIQKPNDTNS